MDNLALILIAVLASPVLLAIFNRWDRRQTEKREMERARVTREAAEKVQRDAAETAKVAREGIERAAILADKARTDLEEANAKSISQAVELVQAVRGFSPKLDEISKTGKATYRHVNSQHVALMRVVADLRGRIAADNPEDAAAQGAARIALAAADAAETDAAQDARRIANGGPDPGAAPKT